MGTIAYQILGPQLGVRWESASRMALDVDLAGDTHVSIAVPDLAADVPTAIESLRMGFFPVPRLSNKEPSTSYAVRSKALRIELFTPARNVSKAPVFIHRLNAVATPLKYLDYLIEDSVNAVMVAGTPCLVKVPQPARYALHKLVISQERDATASGKKRTDLLQAKNMIELLKEDCPGDLELAREALAKLGASLQKKVETACDQARIEM